MKKIVFVCTGNTCRSPMAQAILEKMARDAGQNLQVQSAGLYVLPGASASPNAVLAAREIGLELSAHRAQPLSQHLVEEADLVLCMTSGQAAQLKRMCPEKGEKIWAIKPYAGLGDGDVSDPYGGNLEEYRHCAAELEMLCALALDKLEKE